MVPPTEQQIAALRSSLKRCSPQTVEAAVRFHTTGDLGEIPAIVYGIIERHLPAENTRDLSQASDDTKLIEDLGIDSLTLLEVVLSIEETTGISVENEELREISTLGQVKAFVTQKISANSGKPDAAPVTKTRRFDKAEVMSRLPQQPPFFFLEDAEIQGNSVRSSYHIQGSESFLEGHFKNNPVMPASIVFEALGQAACLWVLENATEHVGVELGTNEVLFASMEEAHFYRRAVPGDRLELRAEMLRIHAPLAVFRGIATRNGEKVAQVERLVLAFGPEVVQHLSDRENPVSAQPAAPMSLPANSPAPAGDRPLDLPVALPTDAKDAPKGSVTPGDRAPVDPEDPVVKGKPLAEEPDRNFGI